ncbi:unnamed protein product [Rotaria socialis]
MSVLREIELCTWYAVPYNVAQYNESTEVNGQTISEISNYLFEKSNLNELELYYCCMPRNKYLFSAKYVVLY